jgi:hypothetical protein
MAAGQGRRWILTGPGTVSSDAAKGQSPPSARNAQASLSWRRHGVPELPVSVAFLVEGGVSTVAATVPYPACVTAADA